MLLKEYRICMPLTVDEAFNDFLGTAIIGVSVCRESVDLVERFTELGSDIHVSWYRIGQLYMISKHSMEESSGGEGIEVIHNEPHQDPVHGTGQYTEKRIYISSKLPAWVRSFVPKIFYITEKAWNYYPFTVTEYTCSFLPKFHIQIETKFESNRGDNANVFQDKPTPSSDVVSLDIAFDEVPERQYKECEDLRTFHSVKTGRGPLQKDWQETTEPIMCSYKRVKAAFEVYGFQGRVENFVHKNIKDILLTGHRQAVAWIDEWFDMSLEDVRTFEKDLQQKTNSKVKSQSKSEVDGAHPKPGILKRSMSVTDEASLKKMGVPTPPSPSTDNPPCAAPSHPLRLNSTPE